jgi:hypothetical protein
MIGMGRKRTKLDASPTQSPLSAKDQNPKSFKRVTMGISRGSSPSATKQFKNSGKGVY